MGIQGLLPVLRSVMPDAHVRQLTGQILGIDALVWLHRAVYACINDVTARIRDLRASNSTSALEGGLFIPTSMHIRMCEERLDMLLAHSVRPYFVFDGGPLPAKAGKEVERAASRSRALGDALAALERGDAAAFPAMLIKAVDVSPQLAYGFIQVLRRRGIPFIVAPYEADAQLAYLAREGIVHAVLTEDSDLIPYGAPHVLYKMEKDGSCKEMKRADLPACEDVSLIHFTDDQLLDMCILAGCDYLPSLHGMGIKMAHSFVTKHRTTARMLQMLKFEYRAATVENDYVDGFKRARMTFLHQRVYDPRARRLTTVTPLPESISDVTSPALDFLGPWMTDERVCAIAEARLDPTTNAVYSETAVGLQLPPLLPAAPAEGMQQAPPHVHMPPTGVASFDAMAAEVAASQQRAAAGAPHVQPTLGRFFARSASAVDASMGTSSAGTASPSMAAPAARVIRRESLPGRAPPLAAALAQALDSPAKGTDYLSSLTYTPFQRNTGRNARRSSGVQPMVPAAADAATPFVDAMHRNEETDAAAASPAAGADAAASLDISMHAAASEPSSAVHPHAVPRRTSSLSAHSSLAHMDTENVSSGDNAPQALRPASRPGMAANRSASVTQFLVAPADGVPKQPHDSSRRSANVLVIEHPRQVPRAPMAAPAQMTSLSAFLPAAAAMTAAPVPTRNTSNAKRWPGLRALHTKPLTLLPTIVGGKRLHDSSNNSSAMDAVAAPAFAHEEDLEEVHAASSVTTWDAAPTTSAAALAVTPRMDALSAFAYTSGSRVKRPRMAVGGMSLSFADVAPPPDALPHEANQHMLLPPLPHQHADADHLTLLVRAQQQRGQHEKAFTTLSRVDITPERV